MKISFCTTCMGRLYHLKQTLLTNIENTKSYPNREFVLLNYNSNDGLHQWAKNNLKPYQGLIKYIHTKIPQYFNVAHAKNIAYKQATGDVLCSIEADTFILNGFPELLANIFKNKPVVLDSHSQDQQGNEGCAGKIAVLKEHFYNVNGYDEDRYPSWGYEDSDFKVRAKWFNNLEYYTCDVKWNKTIPHDNYERITNYPQKDFSKTTELGIQKLKKIKLTSDCIANKNKNWGCVKDLSNSLD